jgi:hypothetical protein
VLLRIARETERSVAGSLGDKIYKSYQKAGGQWLSELYVVPEPPVAPSATPAQVPAFPPTPEEVIRSFLYDPATRNPLRPPSPPGFK